MDDHHDVRILEEVRQAAKDPNFCPCRSAFATGAAEPPAQEQTTGPLDDQQIRRMAGQPAKSPNRLEDTKDKLDLLWPLVHSYETPKEKEFWDRRAANRGVKEVRSIKRIDKILGGWTGNPLDDSDDIDLCRWSEAPEVDAAVNALCAELRDTPEGKGGNEKKRKTNLRMVVVNLYHRHQVLPNVYTRYSRNRNSYTLPKPDNPLQISYRPFIWVVDGLEKLGYIENHKGFYDRKEKNGRDSRMLPTPKLIKLLEEVHGFRPSIVTIILDGEVVRLKRADRRIPYTKTPETERMRGFLDQYNAAIKAADISLELPEDPFFATKEERFDPTKIRSYRVFNEGSFDRHSPYEPRFVRRQ